MINTILSNEYFFFLLLMIPSALAAGFFAGFFGIGGGLFTIPFLFFIFETLNINETYIMHLAVGTSFSIIIPTSIVSVYTHYKYEAVDFSVVKSYGVFVVIGVIIGTIFAASLPTKSLILFFVILLYLLTFNLFFMKDKTGIIIKFNLIPKILFGFFSGFVSSLMGIGGAIMNVPILKYVGFTINKAIGTAAAIGFLIALFGAFGFLLTGLFLKIDLPLSIGFINIPAFLIFIPITTIMAKVGARTVHKIDKNKISNLFGIFLLIIATKFLYDYFQL